MYKVGIELEVKPVSGENRRTILSHLNNVGIPISWEGYTHRITDSWKAVSDSSVHDGGFEIVSKPLTGYPEIEAEVSMMCESLKGKARVDRQTAYHLHIDLLNKYWARRRVDVSTSNGRMKALRQKQVKIFQGKLARNYSYFQPVIDSLVAPSRRVTETECYNTAIPDQWVTMSNSQIESFVSTLRYVEMNRRHCVINYESMSIYGTVEFRQFQGTINKTKIMNWMKLCERFVARTADRKYKNHEPSNYPKTIDGLCDFLGFGKYGVRRWCHNRAISNGFEGSNTLGTPTVNTDNQNIQTAQESASSATNNLTPELREALTLGPDRREADGSPVYGTLDYEIELHMANDQTLYSMITEYRNTCVRDIQPMLVSHLINLVTLWNRQLTEGNYDDFDLRNNVNYLKLRRRIENNDIL